MFDSDRPDKYEAVYNQLVTRLAEADLTAQATALELDVSKGSVAIPMLGKVYLVDNKGVRSPSSVPVDVSHRIVLGHYLLHGGSGVAEGRFVPYRDLPGGMNFARNMALTVEGRLAQEFAEKVDQLRIAAEQIGALPTDPGTHCDAAYSVEALPKLPLMFTFYDADEDFPAEAKLFFDARAPVFLDMECLAVLGSILVTELIRTARGKGDE